MSIRPVKREGVELEVSSLLPVPHGFSTRLGGVSTGPLASLNLGLSRGDDPARVRENYRRLGCALDLDMTRAVGTRQVHGKQIVTVTKAMTGELLGTRQVPECDGLITDVPGLPLVVFSADCGTALVYDPVRQAVGAAHAGWRGTALGIVRELVKAMIRAYGSEPKDLLAALGPCIGPGCFETGPEVPQAMLDALGDLAGPAITYSEDKAHVDLKRLNRTWLELAGLAPENIDVSPSCTACAADRFWSYRRVGDARGSLAAVIALSEEGAER